MVDDGSKNTCSLLSCFSWHYREYSNNVNCAAETGRLDHKKPVRLKLIYIIYIQTLNPGKGWSIYYGKMWSVAMAFLINNNRLKIANKLIIKIVY